MSIEQSFLFASKIYIKNCNTLDSLLYPLAQWKVTSQESNFNDDSNLIIYCGRRLYCNPSFRFYFHTRIEAIDSFLKSNAVSDEFEGDRVILTSVALERKYLLGRIVDQANEILDTIESYHDYYFPYAQHDALLYSVLQRINLLASKTYYFSIDIIYPLFDQFIPLNEKKPPEDKTTYLPRIGIPSDLIWFDIVSLSNLFSQDDFLHHLLESILKNNQQFSQIDILLISRLLCPEHFINALSQYVIEEFDLNTIQINDYNFQAKDQYDVVITKDALVDLIYLGAHLHHYDYLLEGKVFFTKFII
ncbi:unnamed protein product [Adineta steineri]|uniref:Uncharacterized protein n=1 Tax=Adineta steineri TaxID=433720 RepID=A0A820BRT6_9BILA|nr:unnamed protein product [Adineta steineri]